MNLALLAIALRLTGSAASPFVPLLPVPLIFTAIAWPHHDRWDGTGNPRGLAGEALPIAAADFAVADVFDAMTSERAYRAARPLARAREQIAELAGAQFDPRVVEAFLRVPLAEWERIRAEVTAGLPSRPDLSAAG